MFKLLSKYGICLLLSITLSSYLLISSLIFANANCCFNESCQKTFGQTQEIPVKKKNNEFSCGYLKFISSSKLTDTILKNKLQEFASLAFSYNIFETPRTASFFIRHNIVNRNPHPDKCVLNCSFQI
jgi:hypothetical protein